MEQPAKPNVRKILDTTLSARGAAARFGVAPSTAICWIKADQSR